MKKPYAAVDQTIEGKEIAPVEEEQDEGDGYDVHCFAKGVIVIRGNGKCMARILCLNYMQRSFNDGE